MPDNGDGSMKLFRKHIGAEKSATDVPDGSSSSLERLIRNLKARGLYAFKDMSEEEQLRVWDWAKEVIRQYRKTLERNPANIRSVDELPFPKEEIKLAIELSLPLYAQKNIDSMVKTLKSNYKELGVFQSIDAEDKKKLRKAYVRKDKASAKQNHEMLEIHEKYMEIVVSEKKSLLEEINNFANRMEVLRQKQ
jgi:hypothetical protein